MQFKNWFQQHKVFIFGAIAAIATGMVGFTGEKEVDWLVVGYAGFVGFGSYLVKNLRGQWVSIVGALLGSAATIYATLHDGTPLNLGQLFLTMSVNIALAATGPFKPVTYETSKEIVKAEEVPPVDQVKPVDGSS